MRQTIIAVAEEDLPPSMLTPAPTAGDWPDNPPRLASPEGKIWAYLSQKYSAKDVRGTSLGSLQEEIADVAAKIGCTCGQMALDRALNRILQALKKNL